jgi:orotidine-5'-phosphate decarboxylase
MSSLPVASPIWRSRLLERTQKTGNTLCVGLDPVLKKLPPGEGKPADRVRRFFSDLLEAMARRGQFPAAVKPNSAYFEALGLDALAAMRTMIQEYRSAGMLVILDAKRGDISTSSGAYATAAFAETAFGADAVTVAPYMGSDSLGPFQDAAAAGGQGQGIYVLVRTSNPGARDFQELTVDLGQGQRMPLYKVVAEKVAGWDKGDLGAVVGATAPRELEELVAFWCERGSVHGRGPGTELPMLIPGISVGGIGQGGDIGEVLRAIRGGGGDTRLHLLNSSSGVNYAFERFPGLTPAEASLKAMDEIFAAMR